MTSHFPPLEEQIPAIVTPSQVGLSIRVMRGKAFVDQLAEDSLQATFTLHLFFRRQRFKSKPVACCCDPIFEETFLFEFSPSVTSPRDLLSIAQPIHAVIVKTDTLGHGELIGSHHLEWRRAQSSPAIFTRYLYPLSSPANQLAIATEIHGVGA
eukprot:m.161663 g.161663  ORF g.161663 m.161663 type:complete len:154 (+) comp38822_c0_seq4:2-463(+)